MKTIFTFRLHSMVDVITNSSSELFVFEGKEKETLKELIKNVYPDYLREYKDLLHISELDIEQLNMYFSYATGSHVWPAKISDYKIIPGFTFDELYEPKRDWKTKEIKPPAHNGEIQYQLKTNNEYYFVDESNYQEVLEKLPKDLYFLFSMDDNPNYEMQEALFDICGSKFHLG